MKSDNLALISELQRGRRLLPYSKKYSLDQARDDHGRWTTSDSVIPDSTKPKPVINETPKEHQKRIDELAKKLRVLLDQYINDKAELDKLVDSTTNHVSSHLH